MSVVYAIQRLPRQWDRVRVYRFANKAHRMDWSKTQDSRRAVPVTKKHPAVLTALQRGAGGIENWWGGFGFEVEWKNRKWGEIPGAHQRD
jgi:hypothetical protein